MSQTIRPIVYIDSMGATRTEYALTATAELQRTEELEAAGYRVIYG